MIYPLTGASVEFFVPSYDAIRHRTNGDGGFLVVAAHNNTCVEATKLKESGQVLVESTCLDEMEVLQRLTRDGDYTGVYITSTKPVAVIGGHQCANVPDTSVSFCDPILEMAIPVTEWGTEFIVGPILGRVDNAVGYLVRVMSSSANTEVRILGRGTDLSYTIQKGLFETEDIEDASAVLFVNCSKPCMVLQYNKGKEAISNDVSTDPFMTTITPNDHFVNELSFTTPMDMDEWEDLRQFNNFLTLVAQVRHIDGIRINNQAVSNVTNSTWTSGILPGYSVISFPIQHNNYSLHHVEPEGQFMAYVYGHGVAEDTRTGYGFAAGYRCEYATAVVKLLRSTFGNWSINFSPMGITYM